MYIYTYIHIYVHTHTHTHTHVYLRCEQVDPHFDNVTSLKNSLLQRSRGREFRKREREEEGVLRGDVERLLRADEASEQRGELGLWLDKFRLARSDEQVQIGDLVVPRGALGVNLSKEDRYCQFD